MSENLSKLIEEINKVIVEDEPHSNRWNIGNQMIDILFESREKSEMLLHDTQKEGMSIEDCIKNIDGKNIRNPVKVMEEICKFYGLEIPKTLPKEQWREKEQINYISNEYDILNF